jgi:hypothetical protein
MKTVVSFGAIVSVLALSACNDGGDQKESGTLAQPVTYQPLEPSTTVVPHRYDAVEGEIYFYISDPSEKERSEGKATGSVSGFKYLGTNNDKQHILASVNDNGQILFKSYCLEPCVIIKRDQGERLPFSASSVIGAAFEDAINGHLKVSNASEKKTAEKLNDRTYPQFESAVPKNFRGRWDEITQDRCEGREARFYIGDREFYNFEVIWDVTKVKLYSSTEMDLYTTTKDENGNQVEEVWEFKLADGGKSLTSRKAGGTYFRRCP